MFFNKLSDSIKNKKTKKELSKRYDNIELEKGDLLAMLIAAFTVFMPLIIFISAIYILVALFFGL